MRKLNAAFGTVALIGAACCTVCGFVSAPFSLAWFCWTATATVQACQAGAWIGEAIWGRE